MYKTIDLFAGAGGLSFGFQQTGNFKIVAAAEINKNAQTTFRKNIASDNDEFVFIDDVVGCNFGKLSERLGGIEVVIGGPPCQGFSNANRQKNHLISLNNGLVKEYFRAIKEIRPKAFVMENVSMLNSDTHRFYDSEVDNLEIEHLILQGFDIPKRQDKIFVSRVFEGINILDIACNKNEMESILLPTKLYKLLSVLHKNLNNPARLEKYLIKQTKSMLTQIDFYINGFGEYTENQALIVEKLKKIHGAIEVVRVVEAKEDLDYIVSLQKALHTITEIYENKLIGKFVVSDSNDLLYEVKSYSVIDYIKAILGDEYIQAGGTLKAEWFGVPQERRRYIIIGIRKDVVGERNISIPTEPKGYDVITVGEAISDLEDYSVGYEKEYEAVEYRIDDKLCEYAKLMRKNCSSVKNHITTKTRDVAMERFKAIEQGKNFHSLSTDMKSTYTKPERTQNTIYLRLDPNQPSGTVVNVRKSMWIHPTLDRAITVREAARLQSFPDEFEFFGTKDSQYQQVGNAVPPLLAEGIALKVLEYLE